VITTIFVIFTKLFFMIPSITIHIPLKPYLYKFLIKKYGTEFEADHKSSLGVFIKELIDNEYRKEGYIKSGDLFPITIPKVMVEKVGFSFPPSKFYVFENWVNRLFQEQLFEYVRITIENKLFKEVYARQRKVDDAENRRHGTLKIISQFLRSYDITEDDLKRDSIYREYTRFVDRNKTVEKKQQIATS